MQPGASWACSFTSSSHFEPMSRPIWPRPSTWRISKKPSSSNQQTLNIATCSAEIWYCPARVWMRLFPTYRTAVHLNPYEAQYWLDLAGAYQIAGRTRRAGRECRTRRESGPNNPACRLGGSQFLFGSRRSRKSASLFPRRARERPGSSRFGPSALLARHRRREPRFLIRRCHARPDLYLSFLRLLVTNQEVAAAENVWNRLIGLQQSISAEARIALLSAPHRQARSRWQRKPPGNSWPALTPHCRPYLPSSENLVVNGGFEENLLNGGFDWWYQSIPACCPGH